MNTSPMLEPWAWPDLHVLSKSAGGINIANRVTILPNLRIFVTHFFGFHCPKNDDQTLDPTNALGLNFFLNFGFEKKY